MADEAGPSSAPAAAAAAAAVAEPPAPATDAERAQQPEASTSQPVSDAALKEFFSELREVDRDNEVNRVLWAFKLNPYEKLNVRFDATPEEVRRAFRKASLAVHPDKCKHAQAAVAFEVLKEAQKEILDEARHAALWQALEVARGEVRREREKEAKHDKAVELAALLHKDGRAGVDAEYEASAAFHERWRLKARDVLAKAEWRRRKLTKRLAEETERGAEEAKEGRERAKKAKEADKVWESTRESRVGSWRDFVKSKGGKKATGQLKPPKAATADADKAFVRRPVGEQFKPPPPPPA